MTKIKMSVHLSVAAILFGLTSVIAKDSEIADSKSNSKQTINKSKKKTKKSVKTKATCSQNISPVVTAPSTPPILNKSTPQWLRIDHHSLTRPKAGTGQLEASHPFTKALVAAYNNNPTLKAKLREYYATSEAISQALAGWRPTITGTASTGYTKIGAQPQDIKVTRHPKSLGIDVTQNLYQGGTTIANTKLAENQIRASRADLTNTIQETLLSAVQAYTELWTQRETLKTIETSIHFYQQSLEQANAQYDVGENSQTDVAQADFSYQQSLAQQVSARIAVENARANYIQVIGEEPPANMTLPRPLNEMIEFPSNINELLNSVEKYNPAVLRALYGQEAAKDNIDVATGALLPVVGLRGNATRQLNDDSSLTSRQNLTSVTVNLTLPFYNNGGSDWSRLRQVEQTAVQRKHELKAARNQAVSTGRQAWEAVREGPAQINYYRNAVKAGNVNIEGTRQENLVGERTLLDVLQVEATLVDARRNQLLAERDYIRSGYTLIAALGELTPEILNLDVQRYDVDTYPEAARDAWIGAIEAPSDERGRGRSRP